MIFALALALLTGDADPRIELMRLRLDGRYAAALERVEEESARDPAWAARRGMDYLRGDLLEALGRVEEADEAFAAAMGRTPQLAAYSRYRLALNQLRLGHPEVAAGLLATLLARAPPTPLVAPASRLLAEAVGAGGDCRLLSGRGSWRLREAELRALDLATLGCSRHAPAPEEQRGLLLELLRRERSDEIAIAAADALLERGTPPAGEAGFLLGMTFHAHRDFDRSVEVLSRLVAARAGGETGTGREGRGPIAAEREFEMRFALARGLFWRGDHAHAAAQFEPLTDRAPDPERAAEVHYQRGRAFELLGDWNAAEESFRRCYESDGDDRWTPAALLSALRLQWRQARREPALELFARLGQRRDWRRYQARGALFLASSELVRGATDGVAGWLAIAARDRAAAPVEVPYWQGRLAELEGRSGEAVRRYLEILRADPYHLLSRGARERMLSGPLTGPARALGLRLASSDSIGDLLDAWNLLGDDHPAAGIARRELRRRVAADRRSRELLDAAPVPPEEWPLWTAQLRQPEETLLALGAWEQGSVVVLRHFPVDDPSLALTASRLMAGAGLVRRSVYIAEVLGQRVPPELPPRLLPEELRRLLYPFPYADLIRSEAGKRGVDPHLLVALIREESRFEPEAVSTAAARGLTQFILPTARRLAPAIGADGISPRDLLRPEPAVALGAVHLAELAARFANRDHAVIAAYNAGAAQAQLWQSHCFSLEPEEYYSKVGFRQTRDYLRKVASSRAVYDELYRAE